MRTINGYAVIAWTGTRSGETVILGAREGVTFEYVTARMSDLYAPEWRNGNYFNAFDYATVAGALEAAMKDFQQRAQY